MATAHDNLEKGIAVGDVDSSSDKKDSQQIDHAEKNMSAAEVAPRRHEAPEFIRNMTPEVREATELRLRRKLDLRIMPMIVIM